MNKHRHRAHRQQDYRGAVGTVQAPKEPASQQQQADTYRAAQQMGQFQQGNGYQATEQAVRQRRKWNRGPDQQIGTDKEYGRANRLGNKPRTPGHAREGQLL